MRPHHRRTCSAVNQGPPASPAFLKSRDSPEFVLPVNKMNEDCWSRAAEALTAIQALVTGTIAHGDMAAFRTRRGVLLEMGDGIAERFYFQSADGCLAG
jgi:hypothetical protein